jgi:HEAT repeat protein
MSRRGKKRLLMLAIGLLGVGFIGFEAYLLSPDARLLAISALKSVGPSAAPALVSMLGDANGRVQSEAVRALVAMGSGGVPALVHALSHTNLIIRGSAAAALGAIGPPAAEAVPVLLERLRVEDDDNARDAAAAALGEIAGCDDRVLAELLQMLGDDRPALRAAAAEGLGHMRAQAPSAVPALVRALTDREGTVRAAAAEGLGQLRALAKSAVPALILARQDSDEKVKEEATEALERIARMLREDDAALRDQIFAALHQAEAPPGGPRSRR